MHVRKHTRFCQQSENTLPDRSMFTICDGLEVPRRKRDTLPDRSMFTICGGREVPCPGCGYVHHPAVGRREERGVTDSGRSLFTSCGGRARDPDGCEYVHHLAVVGRTRRHEHADFSLRFLPRAARARLLATNSMLPLDAERDLLRMAGGIHGPPLPGISDVEESLRTLPEIIAQPWDIKRGDKFDVFDLRNLRRLEKLQRRARINWRAPRCATFSRAREKPTPGRRGWPARSEQEPYGITSGPGALTAAQLQALDPDTQMCVQAIRACIEDHKAGRGFVFEHPGNSLAFFLPEMVELMSMPGVIQVPLTACLFEGGGRRKHTRLVTNIPELQALHGMCSSAAVCDRTGEAHLPWTKQDANGHAVYLAEEESEYNEGFCQTAAAAMVFT